MKPTIFSRVSGLMLFGCLVVFPAMAQNQVAANEQQPKVFRSQKTLTKKETLKNLLSDLEKKHNVSFICKSEIQKIVVNIGDESFIDDSFLKKLQKVLKPYSLKVNQVSSQQFVISDDRENKNEKGIDAGYVSPGGTQNNTVINTRMQIPSMYAPEILKATRAIPITGTVISRSKNIPLHGVSVSVKGSGIAAATDEDGKFVIDVPNDQATLIFSYVGYRTIERALNGRQRLEVILDEDVKPMEEVVVVGYGTQKKMNLTGAVSQVDSKILEDRPIANVSQALQGAMPGLSINFNDGRPGSNGKVNIRGFTSINGGTPLILIDGIPGDINMLNPQDVATVTVLKDASSAAIYGSRAAYGVILIVTKKGRAGKLQVTYSNNFSIANSTTSHNLMTDGYATGKLIDEAFRITTGNIYTGYTDADYEELQKRKTDPTLPSVVIQNRNGRDQYVWYGNTDWWNYFFHNTLPSMSHSLQFLGGTDKVDFLLSGRFYEQSGIMKFSRDKYSAYNLRAKVNAHINSWLTISNNLQLSTNTYNYPGAGSVGDVNTAFVYLGVHMLPSYVPKNPDGTFTYRSQINNYGIADGRNLQLEYGKDKSQTQEFTMTNTVSVTIQPAKGLDIIGSYSYELNPYSSFHRSTVAPWSIYPGQIDYLGTDLYTESASQDQYQVVNAYATYTKKLRSHDIKILGGYSQEYKKYHTINGQANDLLSQDLNALDLGTSGQQVGSNSVEWALQGYFGRINYSFKDKYLLELDGRYDGSSHFPSDSRYGFFPSVSAGWRISQEGFFDPLKNVVSELKIRGSYGSLGNQSLSTNLRNSNYPYIPVMNTGLSNWLQGGSLSQYLRVGNPITPELTWERTTSANIGVDIGFFNNRLTATIDLYDRKTLDMLVAGKTLPAVFGASSPKQNAANLDTKGYDLSIQWQDRVSVNKKTFSYNVGLVLSNSESHITKFDNPSKLLGNNNYYVGQRIGDMWGYTVDGYFQTDDAAKNYAVNQDYVNRVRLNSPGDGHNLQAGDMKFVDLDGNDTVNNGQNTLTNHGDLKILGNSLPRFPFGITAGGSWNGFSVSIFLQGVGHQDWYPGNETYMFWGVYGRPYYSFIPKDFPDKIWSPENPNAYFPKLRGYAALTSGGELNVINSKYMQNTAYIRLKNLTIGYDLPQSLLQRWKIDKVKIYVSGENIFTATKLETKYVDPEQVSADPSGSRGDNNARNYPFYKNYSCGLNVTF